MFLSFASLSSIKRAVSLEQQGPIDDTINSTENNQMEKDSFAKKIRKYNQSYYYRQISFTTQYVVSILECRFFNCTSLGDLIYKSGGAIIINNNIDMIEASISSSYFSWCKSQVCGGAIYSMCSSMNLKMNCFTECYSLNSQAYFVDVLQGRASLENHTSIYNINKKFVPYQSFILTRIGGNMINKENNYSRNAIPGRNVHGCYILYDSLITRYCVMTRSDGFSYTTFFQQNNSAFINNSAIVNNTGIRAIVFYKSSAIVLDSAVIAGNKADLSENSNTIIQIGCCVINDWTEIAQFCMQKYIPLDLNHVICNQMQHVRTAKKMKTSISTMNAIGSVLSLILIVVCTYLIGVIKRIKKKRYIDFMSIPEAYQLDDVDFEGES